MEDIRKENANYKAIFDLEKEEWFAKKDEIQQELNELKNRYKSFTEVSKAISYDVFSALYKAYIGESLSINPGTTLIFYLNEDKWMNFVKALSCFKLPEISGIRLHHVLPDSEEIKAFMTYSIPTINTFYFNIDNNNLVDGCKYLDAIKNVAKRTRSYVRIDITRFSGKEFCEVVSASKLSNMICFQANKLEFDSEVDFEFDMDEHNVKFLEFSYSGVEKYSDWKNILKRFTNLIAGIAKFKQLFKNLETLRIYRCGVSRETAIKILNEYELNHIIIDGV